MVSGQVISSHTTSGRIKKKKNNDTYKSLCDLCPLVRHLRLAPGQLDFDPFVLPNFCCVLFIQGLDLFYPGLLLQSPLPNSKPIAVLENIKRRIKS